MRDDSKTFCLCRGYDSLLHKNLNFRSSELHGDIGNSSYDDTLNLTNTHLNLLTQTYDSHKLSVPEKSEIFLLWIILVVGSVCNLFILTLVLAEQW